MSQTIIESVLSGKLAPEILVKWLNNEIIEDAPEYCALLCCSRSEFVPYFLAFLRNQTESILQTNTTALNLIQHNNADNLLNSKRKHRRSASEPTGELDTDQPSEKTDSLSVKTDRHRSHESPSRDQQKKAARRVKTKLFNEEKSKELSQTLSPKTDSDDSRLSAGVERLLISSTPVKNNRSNDSINMPSPVTPQSRSFGNYERCDTPRTSHRHSRSQDKSALSFGDYLVTAQASKSSKKKGRTPKSFTTESDVETKQLDLSNSDMFPSIGARKSSSLKSDKRRINPTSLDDATPKKSLSLNSFNSESFQQPSVLAMEENSAFKNQRMQPRELSTSFDVERSILKQERHKLLEKFNILNTQTPKTLTTPQIKIAQKETNDLQQNLIQADVSKVMFKDNIDFLVLIYDMMIKNNLVLSLNSEIYFLISILLSKQYEEDYARSVSQITEKPTEYPLKTIHNSTYFSVKSLWNQRSILEYILEKNSLKILGENKKVRSFYPDLAKFLLNLYGIRSDSDVCKDEKPVIVLENRFNNGMVCFNFETDNADNFPSLLSFQNFKKQRDMFYEILRWYTVNQQSRTAKATFRTRAKTLLSLAISPANHAHLAKLFTAHMLVECVPNVEQESKLSKLQRRLTGPSTQQSHRLPYFTNKEMFYKEFIMYAENESFRVHLKDTLAYEICLLNDTALASMEERGNSSTKDMSNEYLLCLKKLCLLSKFMGFMTSLPYVQLPTDYAIKCSAMAVKVEPKETVFTMPKEKVFENELVVRDYCQPQIDIRTILTKSNENRLVITIPWIVQFLSMLDYTALRLKYYKEILKILFDIYVNKLIVTKTNSLKKNTKIFLKLQLGWLFDLPHFPRDFFYETSNENKMAAGGVASAENETIELVDESVLYQGCPFLRDVNILLLTCKPNQDSKEMGSFRHITPVTMSLNAEDRIRNKEKEIQSRLEEEFLKSQPSSTRRVLEVVVERVSSSVVKQLQGVLRDARVRVRRRAAEACGRNEPTQSIRELYFRNLDELRNTALDLSHRLVKERSVMALQALLSVGNKRPLEAVVNRSCRTRVKKWIGDNWDSTEVLCKDIDAEIRNLQLLGENVLKDESSKAQNANDNLMLPQEEFDRINISPSGVIIELKEAISNLLEGVQSPVCAVLSQCALVCAPRCVLSRPPAVYAILRLSVDLCVVYVSRRPNDVNEKFLNALHEVWNQCCPDRKQNDTYELELPERRSISPVLRDFETDERMVTPPVSDDERSSNTPKTITNSDIRNSIQLNGKSGSFNQSTSPILTINPFPNLRGPITPLRISPGPKSPLTPTTINFPSKSNIPSPKSPFTYGKSSKSGPKSPVPTAQATAEDGHNFLEYFDRILCPRNIVILSHSKTKETWEAMSNVLVFLLRNNYLSEDSLTEQCLSVYRQDWSQNILDNMASCMKKVSSKWSARNSGKFNLFLDFLAEFCGDMDCGSFDFE